jgi:hypothetical protein
MLFVAQTISVMDIVAILIAILAFSTSIYIVIRDNKNRKYDLLISIINAISDLNVKISDLSASKNPSTVQLEIINAEMISYLEILSFLANDHQLSDKHVYRLAEKSLTYYFNKYSNTNLINKDDNPEIYKLINRWNAYPPKCIQNRLIARVKGFY